MSGQAMAARVVNNGMYRSPQCASGAVRPASAGTRSANAGTRPASGMRHPATRQPGSASGRRLLALLLLPLAALMLLAPTGARAQSASERNERAAASRVKGTTDAPVVIYEIADFQCPYCARFAREVMPRIDSAFIQTGKVRWVFINYPIPSHTNAWAASEAAVCAGAVADRFWAMHDVLFENQDTWSGANDPAARFRDYAREIGVSPDAYRACVQGDVIAPTLIRDVMTSTSAQVQGTPTFFIGQDTAVVGFRSFEEWRSIIEKALNEGGSGGK